MCLTDKLNNAKETIWPSDGLSKMHIRLIVWWAKIKVKTISHI